MTGLYLTDLADVCRAAGLTVHEDSGWQTRARGSGGYASGRPWVIMWHHTASQTTPQNDVNYITRGSSDAPLANVYLARDGAVWICAAGATNTNGKGGPLTVSRGTVPVDQMNTYAIGIEAANSGVGEQWPQVQIDAYFTLSNALTEAYGLLPTDLASHESWSPGRKIDPATAPAVQGPWRPAAINSSGTWSVSDIRAEAVARTSSPPEPQPPPEEDEMRLGPYLIQGSGADDTLRDAVYATDGQMMTLRWLATTEALAGYRWTVSDILTRAGQTPPPELAPDGPILRIDTISAYGVVIS